MRRIEWLALVALAVLTWTPTTPAWADTTKDKGPVVELDELRSAVPGDWKEQPPSNRMRLAQFLLPRKGDDKHDAEVVIFKNAEINRRFEEEFQRVYGEAKAAGESIAAK